MWLKVLDVSLMQNAAGIMTALIIVNLILQK